MNAVNKVLTIIVALFNTKSTFLVKLDENHSILGEHFRPTRFNELILLSVGTLEQEVIESKT